MKRFVFSFMFLAFFTIQVKAAEINKTGTLHWSRGYKGHKENFEQCYSLPNKNERQNCYRRTLEEVRAEKDLIGNVALGTTITAITSLIILPLPICCLTTPVFALSVKALLDDGSKLLNLEKQIEERITNS